jgi:hypothetical protein
MELNSFRELLLKKAADNPTLQMIINVMRDDLIAEKVIESLEKMARPNASAGRGANAAITAFANHMKNKDVEMMRDSLGHHISHYKSALKNGNREVADQHLNNIIPLMHLAAKTAAHSGGQLGLDYVKPEPWESNYTTVERRPETGKYKEGTKGLGRRPKNTDRSSNPRGVPDYRYLEMKPHGQHPDTESSKHKGGYPFEEIQLGNPAKVDAKEAHLHIPDVGPQDKYVPHPFDEHPIHEVADLKQDHMTPERMKNFADKMQSWHTSPHNAQWMQNIKDVHAKDPEAFKSRGKVKPPHHFEGLTLQEQPEEARGGSSSNILNELPPELQVKFGKLSAPTAAPEAVSSKVEAPKLSENILNDLPPELQAKFGKK